MAWRNFSDHKEESRAVKAMLKKEYSNVRVRHGRGTAWGWLEIYLTIPRPANCRCNDPEAKPNSWANCHICTSAWRGAYDEVGRKVRELTGRSGEYGGNINISPTFDRPAPEI
jgi:hypothetical protein